MFCMKCGHQLPDGAQFCMICGTPLGAVSPTIINSTETINLDGTHSFVPAKCPNCDAHMKVDSSYKIARCDVCGTECLVQDAIKALTVSGNVQVGNATINVSGTNTDNLLQRVKILLEDGDFSGAMSKCNTILDSDPTNGNAYFYMLMSDLHCRNRNELFSQTKPFDGNQNYINVMRYGEADLKNELMNFTNNLCAKYDANLRNLNLGDEIRFGHYKNGQSIIWKIIGIGDSLIRLLCSDIISVTPYHQGSWDTWERCTLRKWLNNDFIIGYFTTTEQARIINSPLRTGDTRTWDKVFLLSADDANRLNDQTRAIGAAWWLRSDRSLYAAYVDEYGRVRKDDFDFRVSSNSGVRPALWLSRPYVHAMCPNCNAHIIVERSSEVTRCDSCGTECLVQDAIRKLQESKQEAEEQRREAEEQRREAEEQRREAEQEAKQKNPKVGDEIYFGVNAYNKEHFWWKVLSVQEHKALIISNARFNYLPYHKYGGRITWANCTLRKWLNKDFINNIFTPEEQARIIPCKLINDTNPQYNTFGGFPTTDKVFLLSINEANQFFANNQARATGYDWWLRSPGISHKEAAIVDGNGMVNYQGLNVKETKRGNITIVASGVRPALWLNLDS